MHNCFWLKKSSPEIIELSCLFINGVHIKRHNYFYTMLLIKLFLTQKLENE